MDKHSIYTQVAALHVAAIDRGFLSQLGVGFLTLLYEAIDQNEGSALIVETRNDRVIGFVSGGAGLRSIYRRLLRRLPALLGALLPVLLSPRKMVRIIEILLYSGRQPGGNFPDSELFSIAVAPEMRGTDCAVRIYETLCTYFKQRGVSEFKIVVGEALRPAQAFYRKMGAEPVARISVHSSEESIVFVQNLAK